MDNTNTRQWAFDRKHDENILYVYIYIFIHRVIQRRTDRLTRLTDPSPPAASSTTPHRHVSPTAPEECRRRRNLICEILLRSSAYYCKFLLMSLCIRIRPAAAAADEYYLGAVHARRHVSTAHKPDVRQKPQKKKKSLSVQHAYYRGIGRVYVLFSRVNTTTGFSVFIFIIVTRKKVDSFRLELKRIKRQTTATSGKS